MIEAIRRFWADVWDAIRGGYNRALKNDPEVVVQPYEDARRFNPAAIVVSQLANLACKEATFSFAAETVQAEVMEKLCADLEERRQDIVERMLGTGDCWVFPCGGSGAVCHQVVSSEMVRILDYTDGDIRQLLAVIDAYSGSDGKVYMLNRKHTLTADGLTVEIYTTTAAGKRAYLPAWEGKAGVWMFPGATTIGAGRFKSPTNSRGLSPVYGVPLNFACQELEHNIFADIKRIDIEFDRAESKIFADPLVLTKNASKGGYSMPQGFFAVTKRAGDAGSAIDIFSPAIRYSEYRQKLNDDLVLYEQQMGVDRGFLTERTPANTATEVKRANASTIATIDRIHTAVEKGVRETLAADAMFAGVPEYLYTVSIDWFDPFADEAEQYQRLASAVDRGVAEKIDEARWLFPALSDEQLAEKVERASGRSILTDAEK